MTAAQGQAEAFVTAGVVLTASAVALVPLVGGVLRALIPERIVFFARWGFSHALLVIVAGLSAGALASPFVPEGVGGSLTVSLVVLAAAAGIAGLHAVRLQPEGLAALGLRGGLVGRSVLAGLVAYACLAPVLVGLERVWPRIQAWLEFEGPPASLVDGLLELHGAPLVLALAACTLVGPFLEEVVFRGYLQPLLIQNFSEKGGIALTSLVFAAIHPADAFLPIFGLSCLLGALQARTQRLVAPWAVHAAHNALVLFVAFQFPAARELVQ